MNNGFYGFPGSIKPPYKVYTALLTQTSTNPPIATVLENTIGNIYWTYLGVGGYQGNLIGAFPYGKFFPILSGFDGAVNNGGGNPLGVPTNIVRTSNDIFTFNVYDSSGTNIDGYLDGYPIEIRVYN